MISPPDNSSLYKSAEGYQRVMAHYDKSFLDMGIPYQATYVETRFGPTHAVISGREDGKPVVLWHGGNANSTMWADWIPALAPTYRVYAVDTIGEMGKSAPSRPPRTGPAYGQWAAEALQGLGLEQVNVIGVSNGGWLVLKLGSLAPEKIGSAILISAAGFRPMSRMFVFRFMMLYLLTKSPTEIARRFLTMLAPPGVPPGPDDVQLLELTMGAYRFGRESPPVVGDAEIRRLAAPAYLMMAQHEVTFDPYRVIERGLRLLPNVVTAEIVPGAGHMMSHGRHERVIPRILGFLGRYAVA